MGSSTWKNVVIVFLAVAVAVEAGFIWRLSSEDRVPHVQLDEAKVTAENVRLTDEVRRLTAAKDAVAGKPAGEQTQAAPFTTLAELNTLMRVKKLGFGTQAHPLAYGRKLSPKFAELFVLSENEGARLQQAIDEAAQQADRLEIDHATVSRQADGGFIVEVKPFPEKGGAVYDQLMGRFAETLGKERNAAFLSLGANSLENSFGGFGTRAKKLSVEWVPAERMYHVKEEYRSLDLNGTSQSRYNSFENLKRQHAALANAMPEDLRQAAPPTKK